MKIMRSKIVVLLCGASVVASALAGTASAAQTNQVARPRSVFIDDPKQGKDPFFPDSVRRAPVVAQAPAQGKAATSSANLASALQLKGISGSKSQPYALINNATLAEGESTDIRAGSQVVTVRCREIRDRSVLVEIGGTGEIRELRLREGI